MCTWTIERILFLDIDGVLNSAPFVHSQRTREDTRPFPLNTLDPKHVVHLNAAFDLRPYEIVVSSSWRVGRRIIELREILIGVGVKAPVIDKTDVIPGAQRGAEIQHWIEYAGHEGPFVILDDNSDMEPYMDKLVKTSWQEGLCAHHVEKIVQVLDSFMG